MTDENEVKALADRLYDAAVSNAGSPSISVWETAQHAAREALRWRDETRPQQPAAAVPADACPACGKNWGEHRLGYSASSCKQAPPAAAVPATMADGWRHDICATLNRVMPSWIAAGKTPIEAACNAIEALAAVACEAHDKPAAAVPEGVQQVAAEMLAIAPTCENEWDQQLREWAAMLAAALAERNKEGGP